MKPCKAKLPDGKPCPNRVDEGQEYCPYHLASQDADLKKKLSNAGFVVAVMGVATGIYKAAKPLLGKVTPVISRTAKFVASKKP